MSVETVFEAWQSRQKNPSRISLTSSRQKLIEKRLKRYSVKELLLLIEYAYESDSQEARFWRGEELNSNGRTYLQLDNLFRSTKMAARLDNARRWKAHREEHEVTEGVMLSFIGRMRQRNKGAM